MDERLIRYRARIPRRTRGLWAHVEPIFLIPGAAMSGFGALLVTDVTIPTVTVHVLAVCLAVYVAHLKDGYVDYYVRGEDDKNLLKPGEIRVAIVVVTVLFTLCLVALWLLAGVLTAACTAPLLALGYLHAPQLDKNPVTGTVDYPLGIVLATIGGYATQTGTINALIVAVCLVLFLLLIAINIMLDRLDHQHDRRIAKRTLPVALGPARAQRVAWGFVASSLGVLVFTSLYGPLPRSALVAGIIPAGVALGCLIRPPDLRTLVAAFIGSTYVFAGVLFFAIRLGNGG